MNYRKYKKIKEEPLEKNKVMQLIVVTYYKMSYLISIQHPNSNISRVSKHRVNCLCVTLKMINLLFFLNLACARVSHISKLFQNVWQKKLLNLRITHIVWINNFKSIFWTWHVHFNLSMLIFTALFLYIQIWLILHV